MFRPDRRVRADVGEVREGGHEDVVFNRHAADVVGQGAEAVQHRVWIEAGGAVGEAGNGLGIEINAVVLVQGADQRRVEPCLVCELEFVVVLRPVHRQGNGSEQYRRGQRVRPAGVVHGAPGGGAGSEIADVDPAFCGEFIDLCTEQPRGLHGSRVLVRVAQQGGQARSPACQKLRQTGRMGVRKVDAVGARRREVQERIGSRVRTKPAQPRDQEILSGVPGVRHWHGCPLPYGLAA